MYNKGLIVVHSMLHMQLICIALQAKMQAIWRDSCAERETVVLKVRQLC